MNETDRAVVTAVGSLVVAVVAATLAATNSKRLTNLNSELASRRSAEDAKQEYEYDARKRLYEQCQPLIFQANEMAVNSRHRVISLARSARLQQIPRWLESHNYYFRSTVYFMLAPVTTAKILQRRLTAVDLGLETALQLQYELLKQVFITFTRAFELAAREPMLDYDPDRADPGERDRDRLLREHPGVYRRQGFYLGTLELIAEAMIKGSHGEARCASFGEFLVDWDDPHSALAGVLVDFDEMFLGFHPVDRPVLWRVLVAQSMLADLVLKSHHKTKDQRLSALLPTVGPELIKDFDWRAQGECDGADEELVAEPLRVVRAYLAEALDEVDRRISG